VTKEAYTAPPFAASKAANEKHKACMPITILSIGDGKKPFETKANVPSKVMIATFLLLNMPSASFEVFKLTLNSF
jgi:hypothetical protein